MYSLKYNGDMYVPVKLSSSEISNSFGLCAVDIETNSAKYAKYKIFADILMPKVLF